MKQPEVEFLRNYFITLSIRQNSLFRLVKPECNLEPLSTFQIRDFPPPLLLTSFSVLPTFSTLSRCFSFLSFFFTKYSPPPKLSPRRERQRERERKRFVQIHRKEREREKYCKGWNHGGRSIFQARIFHNSGHFRNGGRLFVCRSHGIVARDMGKGAQWSHRSFGMRVARLPL